MPLVKGRNGFYIASGTFRFYVPLYSMPNSAPVREAASVIAQEFLVDEPCSLAVDVPGTYIQLRPGPQKDRVEVDISVAGCSSDEAEDILDRMKMGTQQMKDTIRVYSNGDRSDAEWWRWVRTLEVDIQVDIRLPARLEAEIRAPGGAIDVADLNGHVDLQVMGGPCRAENLEGTLDIRAESSDVTVHGFQGDQLLARAAVGSLELDDIDADTVTLRSVAAPISLTDVHGPTTITANSTSVNVKNLTGPCTARCQGGTLSYVGSPTAETELTVVGSTLDVALPSSHGADLTMTGDTLTLDDDFDFDGERTQHQIEGTIGSGGPPLTLRAIGGSVECLPS